MADIQMTMDAQTGKAVEAFLKVVEVQKRIKDGAYEVTRAGKDAEDGLGRMGSTAEAVIGRLSGIVGATAALGGAMKTITAELDAWQKRGEAAADTMTSLAQKMGAAVLAMPATMNFAQLNAAVESAARTTGLPREQIWPAATQMLPALGPLGPGGLTQALTTAADLQVKAGAAAGPTGRSALELARVLKVSPDEAVGWAIQQGKAGDIGIAATMEGLPRTLNVLQGFGWSASEAAGLIREATSYVKGPEGLVIAEMFGRGLRNLVPGAETMTGSQQLAAGAVMYAQGGEKEQAKLRSGVGRGAAAQSFAGALLSGQDRLPSVAPPGAIDERYVADLRAGLAAIPGMDLAVGASRASAEAEAIRIESPLAAGRRAGARRMQQVIEPLGLGVLGERLAMADYWGDIAGGWSPEEAERPSLQELVKWAGWPGPSESNLGPVRAEIRALVRSQLTITHRLEGATNPSGRLE